MEDLSRELEKELKTHARPAPVKKKIRADFYRIDEFGKMTCVSWIRPLMFFLTVLALGSILTASSFGYLFIHGSSARTGLVQRLEDHDRTIRKLSRDREILMAQLVLTGNTPDLESMSEQGPAPLEEDILHPPDGQNSDKDTEVEGGQDPEERSENQESENQETSPSLIVKPESNGGKSEGALEEVLPNVEIVGIEHVKVMNDKKNGDLLFRFDIKNISTDLDTISGYIFVILKPGSNPVSDWLVIPSAPIDNGRPSLFKRGQYFSISRFKPVNFRVKSSLSPGDFKLACIFVYDEDGRLIAMHNVNLPQKDV